MITACDEYARNSIQKFFGISLKHILTRRRSQDARVRNAKVAERLSVNIGSELRIVRRNRNDQNLRLVTARELKKLLQDPPLVIFILGTANNEKMPANDLAVMRFIHVLNQNRER